MRVLCTFAGGLGHLKPLLPFARTLRAAGHEVAIAGRASALSGVEEGFALFPTGSTADIGSRAISPLARPDLDHEYEVIRRYYAGTAAIEIAGRTLDLIDRWMPDLIVCDEMNFGAIVAAERADVPRAIVTVIASGALTRRADVAEPLARLREAHGLPADPELRMLSRDLVIAPFPPSFRDPVFPIPTGAISVRADDGYGRPLGRGSDAVDWLRAGSDGARVYFTLGTVFNSESGDLFQRVIEGLGLLTGRSLVTIGDDLDPSRFTEVAPNIRIEKYVDQATVLEQCDVVISHGGSGSVIGALSRGVPLVLLPMGADQELNGARAVALGAGLVLDPVSLTPERLQKAVDEVLASSSLRAGAQRMRDEIGTLPPAESVVPTLERLATGPSRSNRR